MLISLAVQLRGFAWPAMRLALRRFAVPSRHHDLVGPARKGFLPLRALFRRPGEISPVAMMPSGVEPLWLHGWPSKAAPFCTAAR